MQNEQQLLQKQMREIIEENDRENSKLEILKNATTIIANNGNLSNDYTREQLTDETSKNFKRQFQCLQAENNDLRSLNKTLRKIIEDLEKESQNYCNQLFNSTSACEVKHRYVTVIKLLESKIHNQKLELKEQSQIIESLFDQKRQLRDHVDELEKSLEEKTKELEKLPEITETIGRLQEQLDATEHHNKELQKSMKISYQAIEERFKREQNALQKVQEALTIAEAAVADKEEALKRERIVKKECDNIASTIGQVMDEAALKVEKDMEAIKNKYVDKEKSLLEEKQKLTEEMQNQKKFNQILDTRCNRFEQKYKDAIKDNEDLTNQLHLVDKALNAMEEKLRQQNCYKIGEVKQQKRAANRESEIKHYVKANKLLKEKYHTIFNDLTEKFEKIIYDLQNEVTHLRAENKALKLKDSFVDKE